MAGQPILTCTATDAVTLRQQAADLLGRLLADREAAERRLAENGRRDPIRAVTGATALERAIASTRDMIAQMDLLLGAVNSGIKATEHAASDQSHADGHDALTTKPLPFVPANRPRSRGMLPGRQRSVAATA